MLLLCQYHGREWHRGKEDGNVLEECHSFALVSRLFCFVRIRCPVKVDCARWSITTKWPLKQTLARSIKNVWSRNMEEKLKYYTKKNMFDYHGKNSGSRHRDQQWREWTSLERVWVQFPVPTSGFSQLSITLDPEIWHLWPPWASGQTCAKQYRGNTEFKKR